MRRTPQHHAHERERHEPRRLDTESGCITLGTDLADVNQQRRREHRRERQREEHVLERERKEHERHEFAT
jgi:hypothetical protein